MENYKKIIQYSFLTYIVCWCGVLLYDKEFIGLLLLSFIPFVFLLGIAVIISYTIKKATKLISVYKTFTLSNLLIATLCIIAYLCSFSINGYDIVPELISLLLLIVIMPFILIFLTANFIIWLSDKIKQKRKCSNDR